MSEIEYKNHTIEILTEDSPESPRDWDNLGTIVAFHNRYELGDKHDFESPEDLHEWMNKQSDLVYLAVHMHNHSNISLSTSPYMNDEWDSNQIGYIFIEKDKITEEFPNGIETEKLESYLEGEIETYNQYLDGDIYGYTITGPYCDDSCWGIYGEKSTIEHAKEEIDATLKHLTTLGKCKLCLSVLWTNTIRTVKCYCVGN